MPKITKHLIDRLKVENSKYFRWDEGDGSTIGFGVAVYPSGQKSFVFQYRDQYGKTKRMTIGKYGKDLTPDQARKKAAALSREVYNGGDPAGEKKRKRKALTVNDLLDEYLKSAKWERKADTTKAADRPRIEKHLRPLLGNKIIETMTGEDVRRAFNAIRDGKTAADTKTGHRGRSIIRGGEGAARMAIRVMRAVFAWGAKEKLIGGNPAAGIELGADGKRQAVLATQTDYQRLFRALDRLEQERRMRSPAADAIRVLALTGARRNEITALRWCWVDLKIGTLTLPAKSHKTGHASGEDKTISLPAIAQQIIARQPGGDPDDFVFQPARGYGPLSLSKPWALVRAEADLPPDMGLHGLRHSLATLMAVQGAQAPQIMAALGHKQLSTAARYIQSVDDARRELMERHTAGIGAALVGEESAEVVSIKEGRK